MSSAIPKLVPATRTPIINRQWTVAEHPEQDLEAKHFALVETPLPELQEGEFLIKTHYNNLAPVMRMYMMKDGGGYSTESRLKIGDVIHGRGVGEVVQSRHPSYKVGEFVQGQLGWQTFKISRATPEERFRKLSPEGLPVHYGLSALGMTGFSAYCGFVLRGEPQTGDAVLVSGAAGGVGSLVVQIAALLGCGPVIGIAGGKEKCDLVRSLGATDCIDYKSDNVEQAIANAFPNGVDLFFDNVGGPILSAGTNALSLRGRVVLCGAISEYAASDPFCFSNYGVTRHREADLRGFFVYNHDKSFSRASADMARWIRQGLLKPVLDIREGFDGLPSALMGLYKGANIGKCLVRAEPGLDVIY